MLVSMKNQEEPVLLVETQGRVGLLTLNRPGALNALNLGILEGLKAALLAWRDDPAVACVVITGAGERGFCAGGDLKHFHAIGQAYKRGEVPLLEPVSFFALEYGLNHLLYHYPKPIVALANGITMGGGYGVAGNSRLRVACDNTLFAMPETKIGFFPDVGAAAHLAKAPHHIGRYLAMSGNTLNGDQMTRAGLADYFVQKESLNNILEDILKTQPEDEDTLKTILQNHTVSSSNSKEFDKMSYNCEAHFRFTDPQMILNSLTESNTEWAAQVLADLRARSPLSVLVALEHYNRAATEDFDTVIARDYQLCAHFMCGEDLYEGIRALILDKDKNPRWQQARMEEVPRAAVLEYFEPIVPPLAQF